MLRNPATPSFPFVPNPSVRNPAQQNKKKRKKAKRNLLTNCASAIETHSLFGSLTESAVQTSKASPNSKDLRHVSVVPAYFDEGTGETNTIQPFLLGNGPDGPVLPDANQNEGGAEWGHQEKMEKTNRKIAKKEKKPKFKKVKFPKTTKSTLCPFIQGVKPELLEELDGLAQASFIKTRVCPFLLAGSCNRGAECNFAHNQTELREVPNLKKTKLCQQFAIGKCQMGGKCSFAHGEEELRYTPEFYKTSICQGFFKGKCHYGDNCRYAHGENELRASY